MTEQVLARDQFVYMGTCPGTPNPRHPAWYVQNSLTSVFTTSVAAAATTTTSPYVQLVQQGHYVEAPTQQYQFNDAFHFMTRLNQLKQGQAYENDNNNNNNNIPNVLMVYEEASYFTDNMLDQLAQLLTPTWNVQILVVHRYWADWLLTVHNALHGISTPQQAASWSAQIIQPFDLTNPNLDTTKMFLGVEQQSLHIAALIRNLYQRHFPTNQVRIISVDQLIQQQDQRNQHAIATGTAEPSKSDPLLEYVLCTWIPNAPNACKQEVLGLIGGKNPSVPHHTARDVQLSHHDLTYDWLAQRAHQLKLVPDQANRKQVAKLIEEELRYGQNQTEADLPWICPLDQAWLQRFQRVAARVDSPWLANWTANAAVQAAERGNFQTLVQENKFCHVQADKVLHNGKWQSFFATIQWDQPAKPAKQKQPAGAGGAAAGGGAAGASSNNKNGNTKNGGGGRRQQRRQLLRQGRP